ncbi:MAG: glycosyltransferase family 4 protein [Candidatus Omnitrophica bacterium]|nr:glycosyltransferase family 4 protein [Candidatus Omnitrophota bacterium]MDD5671140.1 glycosyltransferase family 4 protein [Candidatus Omnitrophota bacterium]
MKICILTKFFPPGKTEGIPRTRFLYAREYAAMGHEVHVITSGNEGVVNFRDGFWVHEIPLALPDRPADKLSLEPVTKNILNYSYSVFRKVEELHEKHRFDIIESSLWDIEGYVTKLKMPDAPVIVRLETSTMINQEINTGKTPVFCPLTLLERNFMKLADGLTFDSWSVLQETSRLYKIDFNEKPYAVIYYGVDVGHSLPAKIARETPDDGVIRMISVGRLEKRKGTDILVKKIIPELIKSGLNYELHIVGRDVSRFDGFLEETGLSYADYVKKHYAGEIGKRIFVHGYLPDQDLEKLYAISDIALCLSMYESFGLLYLEAMRKGAVVLAFDVGGVTEIIRDGYNGFLLPKSQPLKALEVIRLIAGDPSLRDRIVQNAFEELRQRFTSRLMAENSVKFYSKMVEEFKRPRVVQIMDGLDSGGGVSNIAMNYQKLLKQSGVNSVLTGRWCAPEVQRYQTPWQDVSIRPCDFVLFQYWTFNRMARMRNELKAKKCFLFQNITPSGLLKRDSADFNWSSEGYKQLGHLDKFDVYAGFSDYSAMVLRGVYGQRLEVKILPPFMDGEAMIASKYDDALSEKLGKTGKHRILFVGRIVESKRQIELVKILSEYRKYDKDTHLFLVGMCDEKYKDKLLKVVEALGLKDSVHLAGKVRDEELYAYYRSCDLFLSMSVHEGCGLPLIEAAAFGMPVMALSTTAVPYTMGYEHPGLFRTIQEKDIAELVRKCFTDLSFRNSILLFQKTNLERYSRSQVMEALNGIFQQLEQV